MTNAGNNWTARALAGIAVGSMLVTPTVPSSSASPNHEARYTLGALHSGEIHFDIGTDGVGEKRSSTARSAAPYVLVHHQSGETALMDIGLAEEGALSAVGPGFVDISWAKVPGAVMYKVFRDDMLVSTLGSNVSSFRDVEVKPREEYLYRVSAYFEPGASASSANFDTFLFSVQVPAGDVRRVDVQDANQSLGRSHSSSGLPQESRISHRTFIPSATVELPGAAADVCSGYTQFAGDDRWFTNNMHASVKVSNDITFRFGSGRNSRTTRIGETKAMRDGRVVSRRTASKSETYAEVNWKGGSSAWNRRAEVKSVLKARNPFCEGFTGSIYSEYFATVRLNGSVAARSGKHRKMPYHEVYYIFPRGRKWVAATLYKWDELHPHCLAAPEALATCWVRH